MRKSGLAVLSLWLIAACSAEEDAAPEPEPSFSPAAPNLAALPVPMAAATAEPALTSDEPGSIPAAFLGAWDWTGGSCPADSELRMEIGAREIRFYESVGTVQAVREDIGTVSLDLAMEGEGEQWEQTTVLHMIEGGTMLETVHEDPSGEGRMRLKRCAVDQRTP